MLVANTTISKIINNIIPQHEVAKILRTITAVDFLSASSCLPLLLSLIISAERITAGTPKGRHKQVHILHANQCFAFLLFLDNIGDADVGDADAEDDVVTGSCETNT